MLSPGARQGGAESLRLLATRQTANGRQARPLRRPTANFNKAGLSPSSPEVEVQLVDGPLDSHEDGLLPESTPHAAPIDATCGTLRCPHRHRLHFLPENRKVEPSEKGSFH